MTAEHGELKLEYLSFRRTLNGEELITRRGRARREKSLPRFCRCFFFFCFFLSPLYLPLNREGKRKLRDRKPRATQRKHGFGFP